MRFVDNKIPKKSLRESLLDKRLNNNYDKSGSEIVALKTLLFTKPKIMHLFSIIIANVFISIYKKGDANKNIHTSYSSLTRYSSKYP